MQISSWSKKQQENWHHHHTIIIRSMTWLWHISRKFSLCVSGDQEEVCMIFFLPGSQVTSGRRQVIQLYKMLDRALFSHAIQSGLCKDYGVLSKCKVCVYWGAEMGKKMIITMIFFFSGATDLLFWSDDVYILVMGGKRFFGLFLHKKRKILQNWKSSWWHTISSYGLDRKAFSTISSSQIQMTQIHKTNFLLEYPILHLSNSTGNFWICKIADM